VSFITKLRHFVTDVQSIDHQPVEGGFRIFADRAYARYTEWFGVPDDADWNYEIIRGPLACLGRDPTRHLYIIAIRKNDTLLEDQFASIAHEMYHRVTMQRKGLNRSLWVDEMLAFLTSRRFLREQGMADYADAEMKSLCKLQMVHLSLEECKSVKRKPNLFGMLGPAYPPGFTQTTAILGGILEVLVGWEHMCKMIQCHSLEEWIDLLPDNKQRSVKATLNLQ
jgi:hypothetical protein